MTLLLLPNDVLASILARAAVDHSATIVHFACCSSLAANAVRANRSVILAYRHADQLRRLEGTKIGRMAREISQSLGPDALQAGLASVIGKVEGIMQAKMRSGELNLSELLFEAMGMLGTIQASAKAMGALKLGGGDVAAMADMQKSVGLLAAGLAPRQ